MVSRALRAISTANCGWLRTCTLGGFLLFGQKKATKEKAARSRRILLALLAGIGARLTRRAQTTRLGLDQKSREDSDPVCDARRLRGLKITSTLCGLNDVSGACNLTMDHFADSVSDKRRRIVSSNQHTGPMTQ